MTVTTVIIMSTPTPRPCFTNGSRLSTLSKTEYSTNAVITIGLNNSKPCRKERSNIAAKRRMVRKGKLIDQMPENAICIAVSIFVANPPYEESSWNYPDGFGYFDLLLLRLWIPGI